MNTHLQKLTLELLDFLSHNHYVDIFEDVYDAQKFLKLKISRQENYLTELKELWILLNESIEGNNPGVAFYNHSFKKNLEPILSSLKPIIYLQENRDLLLSKLLKKESMEEFNKNDWDHFHDCVFYVLGTRPTQSEMENLWQILPEDLKEDSLEFGMNDTVWRENFISWLKEV